MCHIPGRGTSFPAPASKFGVPRLPRSESRSASGKGNVMFDAISQSWAYAKTAYDVLWKHKSLIVFPMLSSAAAIIVSASFLVPLNESGALDRWFAASDGDTAVVGGTDMYVTAFLFYFCNYFVIVFFNSALVAATMAWINKEKPTVRGGLAVACKRLPQILGWALVSAFIGVLLRAIEASHKRAGHIVSAILGTAWTAMAYFVVPVIVVDGYGPVRAFRESLKTLRSTWGTALVGNFAMGFAGLLLFLPVLLVAAALVWAGFSVGMNALGILLILAALCIFELVIAAIAATDTIFKTLLFSYSTERSIPAGIDSSQFADAFVARE